MYATTILKVSCCSSSSKQTENIKEVMYMYTYVVTCNQGIVLAVMA